MSEIPKGYEEIFAELDREYEEEQRNLVDEYHGEICYMVNKINSTSLLADISIFVEGVLQKEGIAH